MHNFRVDLTDALAKSTTLLEGCSSSGFSILLYVLYESFLFSILFYNLFYSVDYSTFIGIDSICVGPARGT